MLLMSAALAAIGLQRTGWLDRVVQYQKEKLFNELGELAPININAEIRPKPEGYKDSNHWDYESVLRLLTLIRESETAKPVHKALRRMLQPTRRLMMSIKESFHRFPSIKKEDNAFYYDVDYTSSEEGNLPAPPPVPEDQVVLVVSNPVEARLPSARISVKLLRDILEARARAARQMPSKKDNIIPWVEFIKNRKSSTKGSTDAASDMDETTAIADGTSANANGTTAIANGTTANADGANGTTANAGGADGTTPNADGADGTTPNADGADGTTPNADGADETTTTADNTDDTGVSESETENDGEGT